MKDLFHKTFRGDLSTMSNQRRWLITAGVMTGMFIAALEATVVGTAMPTVIATLGGLNHYSWVFSAYLVTSTVTVPVWGKLSDLYGRRLLYQIGIGVFLLGTLLSGLSTTMTQLIVFRAIQGLGAGALVPLGMTIIGDTFSVEERAKMQAYFSGVWGFSSIIGPVIGGFITDQINWRWVFFINLPIGVVAALIIGIALKEPKLDRRPKIDYAGAMLLMIAISILMLAMVEGGSAGLFNTQNLLLLAVSAVLLGLFVYVELRASDPIIPFDLFRNKTVTIAVLAGFLGGIAMFGAISFIPLFAQGSLGFSATEAGSLLTPLMLTWVTASVIGGRLMLRIGYKSVTIVGYIALTLGFTMLAMFDRDTSRLWLYADLMVIGAGLGLSMLTLLIAVQQAVERSKLGIATSLNQFARSIGGAIGVAILGAVLTAALASELKTAAAATGAMTEGQAADFAANPNALIEPSAKSALAPETLETLQSALGRAIHPVFWAGALAAALGLIVVLFLPREERVEEVPVDGERMIMAEQTTINARNQPDAHTTYS
ncbi:MAG TPA: MDR family MFS transporter [Pyrinomonadaceae bacterium]|nr:MDR family MFS transporter [Pyrinomonadaceae bacterium]